MVIIMANSCTGTRNLERGFKSRSMASVSWVGEVVKVSTELARIRAMMRTEMNTQFKMPLRVIFKKPHCHRGSPVP